MTRTGNEKRFRFFSVDQVADYLGLSPRTIRRSVKRGDLLVHKFGSATRISENDLEKFLIAHRRDEDNDAFRAKTARP